MEEKSGFGNMEELNELYADLEKEKNSLNKKIKLVTFS